MHDPPPLSYNGTPYHHPAKRWTAEELEDFNQLSGVFAHHTCCLRCGGEEDEKHRLDWLLGCTKACVTCTDGKSLRIRHVGKPCPRMEMTYPDLFTPTFFAAHAGVPSQPWARDFVEKYMKMRDTPSRAAEGARDRGHKHSARSATKSVVGTSGKDKDKLIEQLAARSEQLAARVDRLEKGKGKGKRGRSASRSASPEPSEPLKKKRVGKCNVCRQAGHFARECPDTKCMRCGKAGHWAAQCPDKGKCFTCHQPGHQADECPQKDQPARPLTHMDKVQQALKASKKEKQSGLGESKDVEEEDVSTPEAVARQLQLVNEQLLAANGQMLADIEKMSKRVLHLENMVALGQKREEVLAEQLQKAKDAPRW